MEERDNRNLMCSVLFLDIVEYSKKNVAGQISLKDRFNSYLSIAIQDIPVDDRIILDTGDGAAINFIGDVEDALKAALSLRESMLNEDPSLEPPLLVRMGINLGPIRLVTDINGQPNIVGDGINVAQRVMAFADASQILVSRSYYDAASRLSPNYAGMFHYQGSRTDKHVREHEIYAIGYPGDKTVKLAAAAEAAEQTWAPVPWYAKYRWHLPEGGLGAVAQQWQLRFKQAEPKQRALYVGVLALPLVLIGALTFKLSQNGTVSPGTEPLQAGSGVRPVSAVAAMPTATMAESRVERSPVLERVETRAATSRQESKVWAAPVKADAEARAETKKTADSLKLAEPLKRVAPSKVKPAEVVHVPSVPDSEVHHPDVSFVSIVCKEGTQLFVDGADKGKIVANGLTVTVSPGKHKIIATGKSGKLYTQNVELEPGKTGVVKPDFCD